MMNFLRKGDELIASEFLALPAPLPTYSTSSIGRYCRVCELILQRQHEGIQLAKAAGKYKGRNSKRCPKDFDFYKQGYYDRQYSVTEIAKHYKVSRPIVYKWLRK